jgi:hypothetical protein
MLKQKIRFCISPTQKSIKITSEKVVKTWFGKIQWIFSIRGFLHSELGKPWPKTATRQR